MLTTYRRVFLHPGALAFSLTGLVARLPVSMTTLGIVLLVSALSDSYALAGLLSAAFVIGNAGLAVVQGRLADQWGQRRLLLADAAIYCGAVGLLVVGLLRSWPTPVAMLLALLGGAGMAQVGTLVRSRWAHLLDDDGERHTAFAVESVVDEVVFVAGPVLVTVLATRFPAPTGVLAALVLGTGGCLALAAQRRTEPPAHPRGPARATAAMPWRTLVPLTIAGVALGGLFGAQEVATVAFASDEGQRSLSGPMLALFAVGSGLAGLVAGAVTWRRTPRARARIGLALLAAGALSLPILPGLAGVSVGLFVTGLALGPTGIAVFSALEAISPRSRLNESMGFLSTGLSAGIAPGVWLAGIVADRAGGASAYWVGGVSAAIAAGVALLVPYDAAPAARLDSSHGHVDELGR